MNADASLSLERSQFLALLDGTTLPAGARAAGMVRQMRTAGSTVSVVSEEPSKTVHMWLGHSYSAVVSGQDPVAVRSIKTANVPFALVDALGLGRTGQVPSESTRWTVRCEGIANDRWDLIHRQSGQTWMITEEQRSTRVRPVSMTDVLNRLCATLTPAMPPS